MSFNMSRFIEFITSFFLVCVHLFLILTVNLKKKLFLWQSSVVKSAFKIDMEIY